ncbi:hypothetical protein ACETRX_36545 [Labrys portucalensis]|uniref:DUF2958 domain-containing protein n=1 Tax=Labrys neptuniae TaxID=376174 RepID=A0ABV6ZSE8_9HYPH
MGSVDGRPSPCRFGLEGGEAAGEPCLFRQFLGGVEREDHLALFDMAAVDGGQGLDLPRLQRLDDLDLPRRLELALRHRDDVDAPEVGPEQGDHHEDTDDHDQGHAHR